MAYNFDGIPTLDAQDPGTIASATVPSGQIPQWLTENIPAPFATAGLNDPFALRGETTGPLRDANPLLTDPLSLSGPNVFSTRPELSNPAAARAETTPHGMGSIPGTYGLLPQDPIDLAMMAGSGITGGIRAGRAVASGPLRDILRYRLGGNPGEGFERVAETVARTAPAAMRPNPETAQGLSDVVRKGLGGGGIGALGAAKEAIETTIAGELNAVTAQAQMRAAQGYTGQYAAAQAAGVRDLASEFRVLVEELKTAGRGMVHPQSGVNRPTVGGLEAGRAREAIYQDIQALLTPDQWRRWFATQTEFAEGSTLQRLFAATKTGLRDVLKDQRFLQDRAQAMEKGLDRLSPDLIRSIFRGGETLVPDSAVNLPFRLGRFKLGLPGTVMAGPADAATAFVARLLSGLGVAETSRAVANTAQNAPPGGEPVPGVPPDPSMSAFWKNFNPFLR